jgi:hypothetical protein
MWCKLAIFLATGPMLTLLFLGISKDEVISFFGSIKQETGATLLAATIAAFAVVWQIGRQARLTLKQSEHAEALKLKLAVYRDFNSAYANATQANAQLSSYIRNYDMEIFTYRIQLESGIQPSAPKARAEKLGDLAHDCRIKMNVIASLIEQWQIVDPRLTIFQTAFAAVSWEIEKAFSAYFDFAIRTMPREVPGHPQQGTLFPWQAPSPEATEAIKASGDKLEKALLQQACFLIDFQKEVQNLLLGELFKNHVTPREPIDPEVVVIRLDDREHLVRHFEASEWGRERRQIEVACRAQHPST